ncbi:MAG: hypothetical protein VKL20_07940, partial [Synechocystis sp.]|nr:hypothetical protein [Synechocystis sp.]
DRLFVKDDPELIAWHERVCSVAQDVKTYLGITVNPDPTAHGNSPISVLKRFLKKLGLELQFVGKQTTFEQHRMYRIKSLNPDGRAIVFERWYDRDLNQTKVDFDISFDLAKLEEQKPNNKAFSHQNKGVSDHFSLSKRENCQTTSINTNFGKTH